LIPRPVNLYNKRTANANFTLLYSLLPYRGIQFSKTYLWYVIKLISSDRKLAPTVNEQCFCYD